jgi:hypothetical protein
MATIEHRMSHGNTVFYAKVRRKGQTQTATFSQLSDAKTWAQKVEVGSLEGKVSPPQYTLSDLLDRYMAKVLPHKKASTFRPREHNYFGGKASRVLDSSNGNPNVYHELGIRHAVAPDRSILVAQRMSRLPFNV